jgi:two-component system cell cycle sensor histidine kinase/response regulator CckA
MKKREVVLVVDEDQWVRDLTRDILELFGHTVLTSESGDHALNLCHNRARDITMLLLDSSGSSAEDIYDRITALNPDVRVIITSVKSGDLSQEGLFRNAKAFLQKPYRMSELMLAIDTVQEMS